MYGVGACSMKHGAISVFFCLRHQGLQCQPLNKASGAWAWAGQWREARAAGRKKEHNPNHILNTVLFSESAVFTPSL